LPEQKPPSNQERCEGKEVNNYMKKETWTCEYCYNKGYSTEFTAGEICFADFIGQKDYMTKDKGIMINFCKCGRGKDLQLFFDLKKEFKR